MNPRLIALLAGIALLGLLGYGIYRAGIGETPPPATNTDIVFKNGSANGERIKTRAWTAVYDKIVSNADQSVLDLDNVREGVIFKKGKPYLRVRAAHMTVNTITHDFTVIGPLHVETIGAKPPRSFDTTSAHWSDTTQRLELNKPVAIRTGANAPLMVGKLVFDVKTGSVELDDVSGPVRFK